MEVSPVRGLHAISWEGDITVDRPIVPSSRPAVGRRTGGYDIDAREFLVSERNAVIKRALEKQVSEFVKCELRGDWQRFNAREPGSFDYRADCLAAFVGSRIAYKNRPGDPWQFPDETLWLKEGDCEDIAFLLASLLLGSGISGYHVRVAIGRVVVTTGSHVEEFDHVWVAYKTESGRWSIIDPLLCNRTQEERPLPRARPKKASLRRIHYRPWYVFNDVHLWCVIGGGAERSFSAHVDENLRAEWKRLDPAFAGDVHRTIMQRALEPLVRPEDGWVIERVNRQFSRAVLGVVGPIVEDIDRDSAHYDPRDHFDNGYITSSWERVRRNLTSFKLKNDVNFNGFVRAAHAIADFYAHSSWGHFAREVRGPEGPRFTVFDGGSPASLGAAVRYDTASFNIASGTRFTLNRSVFRGTARAAAEAWKTFIISGRYAQQDDTQGDIIDHLLIEGPTRIPAVLEGQADFAKRGGLPHHNEIAVDQAERHSTHVLYKDGNAEGQYGWQFERRKNTAIHHIRQEFLAHWNGPIR
jgi:hypothetical protein